MNIFKPWKALKFLLEKAVSTMFGHGSSRHIQDFHSQCKKTNLNNFGLKNCPLESFKFCDHNVRTKNL